MWGPRRAREWAGGGGKGEMAEWKIGIMVGEEYQGKHRVEDELSRKREEKEKKTYIYRQVTQGLYAWLSG